MGLSGKGVLVVGASAGIGRAVAVRAARDGAKVAVVARRRDTLDILTQEIGGTVDRGRSVGVDGLQLGLPRRREPRSARLTSF